MRNAHHPIVANAAKMESVTRETVAALADAACLLDTLKDGVVGVEHAIDKVMLIDAINEIHAVASRLDKAHAYGVYGEDDEDDELPSGKMYCGSPTCPCALEKVAA